MELLYQEETYAIQGAIFAVYEGMGCGFLEEVYQECLAKEFRNRAIPFEAQKPLELYYRGEKLEKFYKPDFVCFEKIIIELKAVRELAPEHWAQVVNYLKVTGCRVGLLVNFCHYPKADVRRIVL
jgi:GxxExxY protein